MNAFGIDVSKHQGKIDWPKVAASGVRFAILRATATRPPRQTHILPPITQAQRPQA